MSEEVDDFLAHYGVMGMKWGRRNSGSSTSRKTEREASRDAKEYTQAKMFFGEGAGVRRRLINNTVKSKSKDPAYKEAFDRRVGGTDMAKRASQARGTRKRTDVSNTTKKTAKGIGHVLRGNTQYASVAAIVVAGAGTYAYKNGGDKILKDVGNRVVSTITNEANLRKARKLLKDAGL